MGRRRSHANLKVQIPVEAGNRALKDGILAACMKKAVKELRPEAAYFTVEGGMRTALFVLDMKDSSEMPFVGERFFLGLDAGLTSTPVMNPEELEKGLARLG